MRRESRPEPVTLDELARVACWSPEHLVRVYSRAVGEAPIATVRRLALATAARMLRDGGRLVDVADWAGYGSSAAFNRAFARAHGLPPLRWLARQPPLRAPRLCAIAQRLAPLPCHGLPYRGRVDGIGALFDETVQRLETVGAPRAEWEIFGIVPRASSLSAATAYATGRAIAAVAAGPLSRAPVHLDRVELAAGWFAIVDALRAPPDDVLEAALLDAGWRRTEGDAYRYYATDPAHTAPPERREWLHLPVVPRHGVAERAMQGVLYADGR